MHLHLLSLAFVTRSVLAECDSNPVDIPVMRIPDPWKPREVVIETIKGTTCTPEDIQFRKNQLSTETPFNMVVTCSKEISEARCAQVKTAIKSASEKLASVLQIRKTVNVEVKFRSFCGSNKECPQASTLGTALPSTFYLAKKGNDKSSWYPQGIVKQYATSKVLNYAQYDLLSDFNGDHEWYFPGDAAITANQTDFEFIAIHELLHGLGFYSAWLNYGPSMDPSLQASAFTPMMKMDSPTRTQGWVGLTIFDMFIRDAATSTNLFDLGARITSVNIKNQPLKDAIDAISKNTEANASASAAFTAATSEDKLVFDLESGAVQLYAPKEFSSSSSMSHLNTNVYNQTEEFLICHDASGKSGVSLAEAMAKYPGVIGGLGPKTREIMGRIGWPLVNQTSNDTNSVLTIEDSFSVTGSSVPSGADQLSIVGSALVLLFLSAQL